MLCTLKIGKLIKWEVHGIGVRRYRSTYETRLIQVQVNKFFFYFMRYRFLICLGIVGSIYLPYEIVNSSKYTSIDFILGTAAGLLILGCLLWAISVWITRTILKKYIPSSAWQERFWTVLEYTTI